MSPRETLFPLQEEMTLRQQIFASRPVKPAHFILLHASHILAVLAPVTRAAGHQRWAHRLLKVFLLFFFAIQVGTALQQLEAPHWIATAKAVQPKRLLKRLLTGTTNKSCLQGSSSAFITACIDRPRRSE